MVVEEVEVDLDRVVHQVGSDRDLRDRRHPVAVRHPAVEARSLGTDRQGEDHPELETPGSAVRVVQENRIQEKSRVHQTLDLSVGRKTRRK